MRRRHFAAALPAAAFVARAADDLWFIFGRQP